jgi:hypothetical protein
MDKTLRNIIIAGITIVTFSIVCFLVYFPYEKRKELNQCIEKAGEEVIIIGKQIDETFKAKQDVPTRFFEVLNDAQKKRQEEEDRCYMRYK